MRAFYFSSIPKTWILGISLREVARGYWGRGGEIKYSSEINERSQVIKLPS